MSLSVFPSGVSVDSLSQNRGDLALKSPFNMIAAGLSLDIDLQTDSIFLK